MLAWILDQAGARPGFLIGGVARDFDCTARLGGGDVFVIEADEYDTAFFDKNAKFLHYRPRTLVINNLEFDHADIYPDLAAIQKQFHQLIRMVPGNGEIIARADDPAITELLDRGCWTPVTRFSGPDGSGDWRASSIRGELTVQHGRDIVGRTPWLLAGSHNAENAIAAVVAARHAGVEPAAALAALARFRGVKRRLELLGSFGEVRVFDDFAHHPTAIATTIAGLRARIGRAAGTRILAVLEPRSNTMKLGTMKAQLPAALAEADQVFCYGNKLGWDSAEALRPLGERARSFDDLAQLVGAIAGNARPGDHVLVMSNGGFGGVHARILAALGASRPAPQRP
jgi:UDP-N-acetylmuramate: L-alanyl-gamma-D-glutamyl-meso-diaminopimelate ligase